MLTRHVPRVAALQPLYVVAGLSSLLVLTAPNASAVGGRFRFAAAAVAAAAAFVLDDDAAATLGSVPETLLARRSARAVVVGVAVAVWLLAVSFVADAITGSGGPPALALLEPVVVGLIAIAVAAVASGRTDDERGGILGATAALTCFATIYLPPRWWWPLTAEPDMQRLLFVGGFAVVVAFVATRDPARRRPWSNRAKRGAIGSNR